MKPSAEIIKKWVDIYCDDCLPLTQDQRGYISELCKVCEYEELPNDAGVFTWCVMKDFDCKKRMSVLILYCRPEKRGRYLRYMLRRLEEIAAQEGAVELAIGHSISGYKENKFDRMLQYFGYAPCAYSKRI